MITFDTAPLHTVQLVEATPSANHFETVTLIRDLKGRIRLMVTFRPGAQIPSDWGGEKQALADRLQTTLSSYWGGQIWQTNQTGQPFKTMSEIIANERRVWEPPQSTRQFTWYLLERRFSKSSWQPSNLPPPWELNPAEPAILSFYSFKGGMGRTTTAAAMALLFAKHGKRVLVLDLDLEAPGVGTFLLEGITPPDQGIVDYLVEIALQERQPANLTPYVAVQNAHSGEPIRVMISGILNNHFLEKMARIDFESFVNANSNPLATLLNQARNEYELDFILLDLRSGLHDLGGLSLNGLSHLDIVFSQATEQSWAGLQLVLESLGQSESRRELLIIHSRDPGLVRGSNDIHEQFLSRSYNLFQQYYYRANENIPDISEPNAPYGLSIPEDLRFIGLSSLAEMTPLLTDETETSSYARLARMIAAYVQKDTI